MSAYGLKVIFRCYSAVSGPIYGEYMEREHGKPTCLPPERANTSWYLPSKYKDLDVLAQ
jgi:hypothetical protein